jgi:hypothetical protein
VIRKLALTLTTPDFIPALAELAVALYENKPLTAWQEPAQGVLTWWVQVARHGEKIHELATAWPRRRGLRINVHPAGEEEHHLLHLELDLDLEILLRQKDARMLSQHLFVLLQAVKEAGWYQVTGKLGNHRVDQLPPVLKALVECAAQHEIFLEPAPPPPPRTKGKKTRKKAPPPGQGSFGGLPDDEPPSAAASPGSLGDEEQFFLSYARLVWPCGEAEIKVAHRQVVKAAHPDKHADDPAAHHRFLLLQRGFEGLLRRING